MHLFRYRGNELYAEDAALSGLAERYGTPLYVYSEGTILRHINAYEKAFDGFPHILCYALKANSNLSILRLIAKNGGGADIVSGGELYRARKAGIPAKKTVYAGVGKTDEEIRYALGCNILMFNVESKEELFAIDRIAGDMKAKARISLRVNPDIDPQTHPYISTGLRKHKFGIPIEDALEFYHMAAGLKNVKVVGVQKHIGSQLTKVAPFVDALKKIVALVDILKANGIDIKYIDAGGGLGIPYNEETPPRPRELLRGLLPLLKGREATLIVEPGRSIVGSAGLLLTRCLYAKKGQDREFVIVDAGMNDLMRPTLYGAFHKILPVRKKRGKKVLSDIVGPICESGDFLARERHIAKVAQGELLAVMSGGAYGFSMSSNYNSRPRAAEVMVKGASHRLIRKRETYRDLTRGET